MNILKEVLKHEVFPALGCTEPIAIAYAASIAAREIKGDIEEIDITVDPGVYKNGFAVTVPNTGGEKGNLIAGVLGALIKKPELKMEILQKVSDEDIRYAKALIQAGKAKISYDNSKTDLYVEVFVKSEKSSARAVIQNTHTNLVVLEKDSQSLVKKELKDKSSVGHEYRTILLEMQISEIIELAQQIDDEDYDYIKSGIDMNLEISKAGQKLQKVGYYIYELVQRGLILDDTFSSSKILTASAADARMAGLNFPVMSSGGSGNQGIVAILVPYNVGKFFKIKERRIVESIALSHLINSYIKCFTGDLSPLCGCAIAAGVGAAVAIVFQQYPRDMGKITLAVNNLISDLGGMLCDGAKGGCALKVASSTNSAIRSAYMALNNYGISETEGFVGKSAEETICNLSKISILGMAGVDDTILGIMRDKIL
ncbi:MAG: L-serine ammonia-lyase, iron-sulfur-dependent, subunit alpha [Proteobacteria bacterium]|nr:serine dehydratase subunit alpha family protein [Desulfobacteraceae bacterium]MBU2522354.1 L-serine ammonia-lyase, iron-sulfur-dependent, subunit alpha [Pseudomonadota bacterium]MBU4012343.1 L-serine ammonia-lyase, iron-sulfur-dependent, subunit alpha [Pseudomonadota bacterium]MBU4101674.1 L-serine ammonia-lyase, iron-sulfur-dependent, subunit alpha [Pseudomonadota bacterium]